MGTLEATVGVHSVGSGTWGLLDQLTLKQSAPMPAAHSSWVAVPSPGPSLGPGVLHKAPLFPEEAGSLRAYVTCGCSQRSEEQQQRAFSLFIVLYLVCYSLGDVRHVRSCHE